MCGRMQETSSGRVVQLLRSSLAVRKVRGVIPGLVTMDTVSLLRFFGAVLPRRYAAEMQHALV